MIIRDLYSRLIAAFEKNQRKDLNAALRANERLTELKEMAEEWGEELINVQRWMSSQEYRAHQKIAEEFVMACPSLVESVEKTFGTRLGGELRLSPSMMRFDGFARYDLGGHVVWFGVDHPDADLQYLQVLLAHELSHVYRDTRPAVWAHLGKPLAEVTRPEYLDAMTGEEHLASEGLATLFSQIMFPQVPIHVHHYYFAEEMQWCLENVPKIEAAIMQRLRLDGDVWIFYEEGAAGPGSPSRTQYFWAALKIAQWLQIKLPGVALKEAVILAHSWPASAFECFA